MKNISKRIADLSPEKRALLELRLMKKAELTAKDHKIPRRGAIDQCPLSFAQQRLWFLDQFDPGNSVYNIPKAIRLFGLLDFTALEKSLNEIVQRHEALRTTFSTVQGEPVQIIAPTLPLKVSLNDLRQLSANDREGELRRIAAREARQPFDLARGPLLRAALLRVDDKDHVLLLTLHHIVSDGWSMRVLFRELSVLYTAFCTGESPRLSELPVQYADYAVWQRQWLQNEILKDQLLYWKEQLNGAPPFLELPTDRPRPAIQANRGARHFLRLPPPLASALKALSREEGVTLFMVLLAGFKVLLYRYTGQEDIIIGSPVANRTRVEIEELIGFFVNTLILRTDMSGNPTFRQLLVRVREVCLGAYAHQDLPFEKLVEELKPERTLSHSPLFQVMFILQNTPGSTLKLPGLTLSPLEVGSGSAKFDLTLSLVEESEDIHGELEYDTDLFDAATIERLAGHYQTILEGIVADLEQHLSGLPVLTSTERQQLLVEWNDTETEYPRDKCVHHLFEAQVEQTPDATALVCANQQLAYRELNRRANQLANFLQMQGVESGVLVGICMERSIEMMAALLGILKAGGAYVPLDPAYPEKRLRFILQDSKVPILLTHNRVSKCLPESRIRIFNLDIEKDAISRERAENPIGGAEEDHPAYIIYTSGSTGTPKGVIGLHQGALNRFEWMWNTFPFEEGEVCCQKTSLSFVDSVWEIFGPLLQGIPTALIPDEILKDPHLLIESLAGESVTRIVLVPSFLQIILDTFPDLQRRLPKLKFWITSGEEISVELVKKFHKVMPQNILLNLYGSTEVSADCSWYDTGKGNLMPRVPIGRPISNTQIYLLDSNLQPVPIGIPGEIHVGGSGLAEGYLNQPELTKNKFIPNPFISDGILYRTGDLARYRSDGNLEFLGRLDHQVKIRGYRIELGEIEAVMSQHPKVRESVVIVHENTHGDRGLVAYLAAIKDDLTVENDLRQFLQERLPDYMVPSAFVFLNNMPLTPSGKVDRKALPAPHQVRSEPAESRAAPRDEIELQLTKTWERVLGVHPIGVNDNFFELGGHSLLAVRLITQIEKILGKNLPIATLFRAPTIERLASILCEQGKSAPEVSLDALELGGIDSRGMMRIKNKVADHIPRKSHAYLKQQYHKIKKHPGYRYLKRKYFKARNSFISHFLSYQPAQLEEKLREIGLTEADTVYMHSAFDAFNGFSGGPHQIIDCILNVIGDSGNLLMVSMAYTGATGDYLNEIKTFDVTKTESSMGIITEIFRRKKDVVRSLNPAHPILAFGPDAEWIISDHDKTMYSCGKGSPFEKILELNAKAFFFDVPFRTMTFFHYLEDKFRDSSPVQLYDDEPLESTVIDSMGNEIRVKTYIFSKEAREKRGSGLIERELINKKLMKTAIIGNTKLTIVNLRDVFDGAQKIVNAGMHFYKT